MCAVRGDAVGSGARRGAAGGGDRRHGAATQAGARQSDADREGRRASTQRRSRPVPADAVAVSRQTQMRRRRHTGIETATLLPRRHETLEEALAPNLREKVTRPTVRKTWSN